MSVSFRKLRSRLLDEKISMAKLMKMSGKLTIQCGGSAKIGMFLRKC